MPNTCGTSFDERYNPSRTGNVRVNSRFTLADGLVLTVDPSYQYTLANGGGTVTGNEGRRDIDPTGGVANCTTAAIGAGVNCHSGYFGRVPYAFRDLNGDGAIDKKDVALAKQMIKKLKEERAAEIKKYDKNGDGKLDGQEDAVRIADQARERASQKPSAARSALDKPILDQ